MNDRVHLRIAEEFNTDVAAFEREFEEVMGKTLKSWLDIEFFKHHIKQFKKRPIAWQLQSGRFTTKLTPAFACFVYYHKLDPDTLPKIRSQYTGPLRQRLETELRGIKGIPADSRSARQDKRRVELERLIEELQNFDTKLKEVTEHGFGPNHVIPQLRQYAIDDAMLCLKARWLKRLSRVIQKGPLMEWKTLAEKTDLHQDLPNWIAEPIENLDHLCSRVGPAAPKAKDLKTDPVSKDLAAIICPHADEMIINSLRLACESWWKKLDEAVFSPLRSRIRELQEKIKSLKEDIAEIGPKSPDLLFKLEIQIAELKGNTKALRKELYDKTQVAKKIREKIEGWTCHDASTWEPWLSAQPMYDLISSLDGQRKPPESVQDFIRQESYYAPDINDGVRVNIAPIQKAGLLAADVLAKKDVDKAIADRAEWRADERRWCREGKLPQPGWWVTEKEQPFQLPQEARQPFSTSVEYIIAFLLALLDEGDGSVDLYRLAGAYSLLALPDLLVKYAPPELKQHARQWKEAYCEEPQPELLRPVIRDLAERGMIGLVIRDSKVLVLLYDSSIASSIEPWVRADAFMAFRAVEAMDQQTLNTVLQNLPGEELQALIESAA